MSKIATVALLTLLLVAAFAPRAASAAPSVTINLAFYAQPIDVYVSTSDTTAGTLLGTSNGLWQPLNLSAVLTPGVTNYLHFYLNPPSGEALAGTFTLSANSGFAFANGSTSQLLTSLDFSVWYESRTGFGVNYQSSFVSDNGNGGNPALVNPLVSPSATWMEDSLNGVAYFTTALTVVPEPPLVRMLLCGTLLFVGAGQRRRVAQSHSPSS